MLKSRRTKDEPTGVFCLGCSYDLKGVGTRACPECGEAFDPEDPSTFRDTERPKQLEMRRVFVLLAISAIVGGVVLLANYTVIPRPAITRNGQWVWTVWLWLDTPYGVYHEPFNGGQRHTTVWDGQVTRVALDLPDAGAPTGVSPAVTATRNETDWTLEVHRAGVDYRDVLRAFNDTRKFDEVIGIQITGVQKTVEVELKILKHSGLSLPDFPDVFIPEAIPDVSSDSGDPARSERHRVDEPELVTVTVERPTNLSTAPFAATGSPVEVMQAVIDHYQMTTIPFLTHTDREHVWVQKNGLTLERVTVQEARDMGLNPQPILRVGLGREFNELR